MAIVLFKWLGISILSALHPFYVSVTEINHNATEQTIEITCKFFVDDFEKALSENGKYKIDLQSAVLHEQMNQLINSYLKKHFKLKIDGKESDRQFVGFEVDKESAYCYLQMMGVGSFKKIEIFNTMLFEEFNDQINIFHVTVNGKRQSMKLEQPKTELSLNF